MYRDENAYEKKLKIFVTTTVIFFNYKKKTTCPLHLIMLFFWLSPSLLETQQRESQKKGGEKDKKHRTKFKPKMKTTTQTMRIQILVRQNYGCLAFYSSF